jgi:C4-dicarboxylate-specific signal transduction histidine kinase
MEKKILLVDDEADIREVLSISLSDMGYKAFSAENGQEALEIFEQTHPPIVLTDIKMPGMDGLDLLNRIKQIDPDTEVIMITGHGDINLAVRSFQYDASDFITKPIGVDALEAAVRRAQEKILVRTELRQYTEKLESLLLEKTKQLAQGLHPEASGAPHPPVGLQQVLDRLPCYLLLYDEKLQIAAANRRFEEDFGAAVDRPCYQILTKRGSPCPECPVSKTFADGKSYQYEMDYVREKGEPQKVLAWTFPVRSPDGATAQVMVMSTDIAQISELQDHLSSLGLMMGSLSHGIKGLLTGLDSGMYLLDSGLAKENAGRTREGLEVLKQTSERLKKMVLNILFYAKDRELKKETVDVSAFAEDVARTMESKIVSEGIAFVRRIEEPLGKARIDIGFLHQAVINVIENALDACREDSKPSHTITFTASGQAGEVRLEVIDDGIGMDPETRANMFNMFFSSKRRQGTGLGLFISRKIIEQHGGSISAGSEKGRGTRIRITLPRTCHSRKSGDVTK